MSSQTYFVQIVEPSTGKLRILCLYDGISEAELTSIYYASFEHAPPTVGFSDERGTNFPFSLLWRKPCMFSGAKLFSVNEVHLTSLGSQDLLEEESDVALLSEDFVKRVFALLDQNNDDVVHKEEFIQVAALVFDTLLETDGGVAFAFQCLSARELAVAAAMSCYHDQAKGTYFLEFKDFCAWLLSTSFDPIRDLLVKAMERTLARPASLSPRLDRVKAGGKPSEPSDESDVRLRRSKSRVNLNLEGLFDDSALSEYFSKCRDSLSLHPHQAVDLFRELKSLPRSAGPLPAISWRQLKWQLLQHTNGLDSSEPELHTLLVLLGLDKQPSCPVGYVASMIALIGKRHDRSTFDAVFQCYQDQASSALVNDIILCAHITMVIRAIFYFCPALQQAAGCEADQLANALYVKVLLSAEVKRRAFGKLSLDEFVETFAHALRIGLRTLCIDHGYFSELLAGMVGYARVPASPTVLAPLSAPSSSLEDADDQIAGLFVSYNGASVGVAQARQALGLYEYTALDVVRYFSQLADGQPTLPCLSFQRGVLRLIADHYVAQSVLERSVADFVLDRIVAIHDTQERGVFGLVDLSIALLLFCEDDDYSRGMIALALVKNKVLKFSSVAHAAGILFKTCYSLNPVVDTKLALSAGQADAIAYCMEFFMNESLGGGGEDAANATFSHAQFVKLINATLAHLESISEELPSPLTTGTSARDGRGRRSEEDESEGHEDHRLESFSDDEDEDDEKNPFLSDEDFPPSAAVLELRAAACMLGLEGFKPEDLLDKLGSHCHAGKLNAKGWAKWFSQTLAQAEGISDEDMDVAMHLGNQVFAAFASKDKEVVEFSALCPGLAFMCAQSPLEDRLMVAFTVVDSDSDGFVTFDQLVQLIKSVLTVVTMCSRLASRKVVALEASLHELALAAAKEGYHAANMGEDEDMSLETFCDLADDFLKLASVV